jgi:hypothetical protein
MKVTPKWCTTAQAMLGFGLHKTKMLVATGELRSLKDGKYRRILPNGWTSTSPVGRGRTRDERTHPGES